MERFHTRNFKSICDLLATMDPALSSVIQRYGYPPMWTRPNTFASLVHIILEQQVSLASARAALQKLEEKTGAISPEAILRLSDEEMRACYVSRQKTVYIRNLAQEISSKRLRLSKLTLLPEPEIRSILIALKGIGHWTADVYLIFVLQRSDIFPWGDLAALNALRRLKGYPAGYPTEQLRALTEPWRPYRSVAAMILWHHYLSSTRKNLIQTTNL